MEIQYHNTREDYRVFYEWVWNDRSPSKKSQYYYGVCWCLFVLVIATYIAAIHEETFAACLFVVLACVYLKQHWSFADWMTTNANTYANIIPDKSAQLAVNEFGAIERYSGIELHVPWSEMQEYCIRENRLFIRYRKLSAFIIPFDCLSAVQAELLIQTLEQHSVRRAVSDTLD